MYSSPVGNHPDEAQAHRLIPQQSKGAFFLVTGLFFLWAIPNNLNDLLIRQFMKSFEITRLQAGLVQSAFYFGYFASPIQRLCLLGIAVHPFVHIARSTDQ